MSEQDEGSTEVAPRVLYNGYQIKAATAALREYNKTDGKQSLSDWYTENYEGQEDTCPLALILEMEEQQSFSKGVYPKGRRAEAFTTVFGRPDVDGDDRLSPQEANSLMLKLKLAVLKEGKDKA